MFKTTMLAAFAAISMCALAQGTWREDSRDSIDATGKSHYEIKQSVLKQSENLQGGGPFDFQDMLDRMPGVAEDALISGLFCAHRQAAIVRHQIVMARLPVDQIVVDNGIAATVLAEETDATIRPMRMVMQDKRPSSIDYDTALDILCTDLSTTQTHQLETWWDTEAGERQKDIICRLLEIDAKKADDPIYVSLYTNCMKDWPKN